MKNMLIKTTDGYNIVNAVTGEPVAALVKEKRGYTKLLWHAGRGEYIRPAAFNYFATLRDVKRYYDI